jgi:phosphatidylglycerol:prolipoprotein diacylglycerol transferase
MRPHLVHLLEAVLPATWAQLLAPTWFTFVGLAGALALALVLRAARRGGVDTGAVAAAMLGGYLAAVIAGIAVPAAIDVGEQLLRGGPVRVRWAGMTSFWGYLGGLAAIIVVLRRHGVSLAQFGDLVAAPLGAALVLARTGCFVAGCDYGTVTAVPWALRFPAGSPAWRDHVRAGLVAPERAASLPVHPAQLYEAAVGLVMIAVAIAATRLRGSRAPHGRVFLLTMATYAIGRLGVEALRGDIGRGFIGGLSSGQVFALAALAAIAGAFVALRRRAVPIAAAALLLAAASPRAARADAGDDRWLAAGLLLGASAPLNRRADQVETLAGPSLSVGLGLGRGLSLWLDLDSHGNQDATHGSIVGAAGFLIPTGRRVVLGARFGAGSTLVNFREPAFRDVAGVAVRAEAIAEYALSDRWVLWVRPISLDLLTANDLGGPILTWQLRIGVGYRHRLSPPPASPRPPPPAPPPPPHLRPYVPPSPSPTPSPSPSPSPTPSQSPSPSPTPSPVAPSPYGARP